MSRFNVCILALLLVAALPAVSRAQGVFPGGWAPQFGYQVVVGPGAVGFGASAYGYGYPGFYGMNSYGGGFGYPAYPGAMGFNNMFPNGAAFTPPVAPAVNAVDPLIHSIRHATKKRRTR